ncbi:hypothetical protein T4B_377 [Trichinella pseudospiralis]|uniref:Uncharacterized protein n=1 Tax=Trichinella pseudospiralis TaxID=6337 RepID=A0A0V1J8C8_TRIPS|nr:hypothetical protein T4B_377 [Trichinella pseudospiralis]KRZ36991.1 hypothetical protein T4C_12845 [Trichinella pseudospiralis]
MANSLIILDSVCFWSPQLSTAQAGIMIVRSRPARELNRARVVFDLEKKRRLSVPGQDSDHRPFCQLHNTPTSTEVDKATFCSSADLIQPARVAIGGQEKKKIYAYRYGYSVICHKNMQPCWQCPLGRHLTVNNGNPERTEANFYPLAIWTLCSCQAVWTADIICLSLLLCKRGKKEKLKEMSPPEAARSGPTEGASCRQNSSGSTFALADVDKPAPNDRCDTVRFLASWLHAWLSCLSSVPLACPFRRTLAALFKVQAVLYCTVVFLLSTQQSFIFRRTSQLYLIGYLCFVHTRDQQLTRADEFNAQILIGQHRLRGRAGRRRRLIERPDAAREGSDSVSIRWRRPCPALLYYCSKEFFLSFFSSLTPPRISL